MIIGDVDTGNQVYWVGEFSKETDVVWVVVITKTKILRWGNTSPGSPEHWYAISGPAFSAGRRFSVTVGEGYFFFTFGGDIYRWDGLAASDYEEVPVDEGSGIFVDDEPQARYLEYFNDRLILGYTIEDDATGTYANRLRWPENGAHTKWDDTLGEGAGSLDLFEEGEEAITGIKGLQERLVTYTRRSIVDVLRTGLVELPHVAQTRVRGIGCGAPYTLQSNGVQHFFMSYDRNVYSWDGIGEPKPIGNPILDELRAVSSIDVMDSYFATVLPHRDEYWLVVDANNVFVYDWLRGTWTRDTFPDITALGEVVQARAGGVLWNSAYASTHAWGDVRESWSAMGGAEYVTAFAGRSSGETFQIDEQYVDDYFAVGSIVDKYVETADFYFPGAGGDADPWEMGTINQVLLAYDFVNSVPFEVGISFDHGRSWYTENVTPIEAGYSQINFNRTGNVVRFRFRENNALGNFRWRHFSYEFFRAGPYRPA
jgi:hypothetical protein